MRRNERVDVIRKLADRLEADGYADEDVTLILDQFGFSPGGYEYWDGSRRGYLLQHLQQGADEGLVDLDEYLSGGTSRTASESTDLPWEPGAVRLFVSHTSAHAKLAGAVRAIFLPWRVDAFVAHTTIEPSRDWELVIRRALASCDAMAALVSDDFRRSAWCDQEVGYCLARNAPIVPVRLHQDPHGFIAKYQAAVPKNSGAAWVADAIFRALARNPAIRILMAAPVVHRFSGSRSFDGARSNFALLREIPAEAWTRELVEVADRACANNGQVEHAVVLEPETTAMPDAVSALLRPHRERLGMNTPPPSLDDDIPF